MTTKQVSRAEQRSPADDPLDEVLSRLVPIHAALAERPGGDADLHRWTRQRLMEVIQYIDEAMDARSKERSDHATQS